MCIGDKQADMDVSANGSLLRGGTIGGGAWRAPLVTSPWPLSVHGLHLLGRYLRILIIKNVKQNGTF